MNHREQMITQNPIIYRAADGSLHTVEAIIESGNEVTVIEP